MMSSNIFTHTTDNNSFELKREQINIRLNTMVQYVCD